MGDGGYDFNPIGDLTVREVYDFLRYLDAPQSIIDKNPPRDFGKDRPTSRSWV